ncbi:MAG: FtsX-like permease family protein [Pseudomonadota bacterium]
MTRTALTALLSHWRRHLGQAATLILGLALATALWTGVQAINSEARASYDRAATALRQNDLPLLVPAEGDRVAIADYVVLRRAGWAVAPVVEGVLRTNAGRVTLVGLDPLTAPALPMPVDGVPADAGTALSDFLTGDGELRGHPETIAALADANLPRRLVPTNDLSPGTLVADIGIASELLGFDQEVSRLLILTEPTADRPSISDIAPNLTRAPPQEGTDIRALTGSFHLNLTAFGFLSFAVGLFIVHGAIGLAFEQRRGIIRTLRALGVPLRTLIILMLAECLAFALVAGAVGVALGYALAALLLPDVAATLRGLYGAPVGGSLTIRPEWWLAGFAIAILGTLLAATQSLWSLSRLSILAPARPRAWAMASGQQQRWLAIAGSLILLVSAGTTYAGSGLVAGFTALACLLIGAALALPWLLAQALTFASARANKPLSQWFWADARQQVPGLSLALMALLLALSANIGVVTMVASFRATFVGWLDQRLASEVYVNFGTEETTAAAIPWLSERTIAILPVSSVDTTLNGRPGLTYGMADHVTYRDNWPLLAGSPSVWDDLAAGDGVLINEQWHYQDSLRVGDLVQVDDQSWRVLGIYSDYGNPSPQAILGYETYAATFPAASNTRFALRTDSTQATALTRDLVDRFNLRPDQVTDQESLKAVSREIFERTFVATDALNVLTLAVAGFAMLTSLLTLQTVRLPQVAPLWALGITRKRLAVLDLSRAAMLALATAILALPTGLALAWLLLAKVNVEAFGWRLPMQAFPLDWLALILAAVAAALLAAALPARKLSRLQPADLLRVFADAR